MEKAVSKPVISASKLQELVTEISEAKANVNADKIERQLADLPEWIVEWEPLVTSIDDVAKSHGYPNLWNFFLDQAAQSPCEERDDLTDLVEGWLHMACERRHLTTNVVSNDADSVVARANHLVDVYVGWTDEEMGEESEETSLVRFAWSGPNRDDDTPVGLQGLKAFDVWLQTRHEGYRCMIFGRGDARSRTLFTAFVTATSNASRVTEEAALRNVPILAASDWAS